MTAAGWGVAIWLWMTEAPRWQFGSVLFLAVFATIGLVYLHGRAVWQRQRQALLELKAERDARPKAIAWCENDGETVFLCVRNIGLLGAFYATLNVKGPVHNAKRDGYAWWTHTNRQKTNIPHGAEFKAKLAVLEWTGQMAR